MFGLGHSLLLFSLTYADDLHSFFSFLHGHSHLQSNQYITLTKMS